MRTPILASLFALALFAASSLAEAQNAPAAQQVLDRARNASGGRGWNMLRGIHETGTDGGEAYEAWADPLRFGVRTDVQTPAGKQAHGYNDDGEWHRAPDGRVTGWVDKAGLARTRSDAFFAAFGFLYPSRFDTQATLLGIRQSRGRSFDVVRLHPKGGQPRDLWFDRGTHLLDRTVDAGGARPVTVEYSDYRKVGPVLIPFRTLTYGGDLPRPRERRRDAVDFRPADRSLFSLPPRVAP